MKKFKNEIQPRTLKGRIDVELQQQFGQASSSSIAALENLRRIFAAMNFILCQHQSEYKVLQNKVRYSHWFVEE
jgi:hypothetical protein